MAARVAQVLRVVVGMRGGMRPFEEGNVGTE